MTPGDDLAAGESNVTTANRRAMLRGMAAGFVLTASGLILSLGEDEAAAREGANGGELGGRHGNNRRGRNQRQHRRHDNEDNGKASRAGDQWRNVAVFVHNYRASAVSVRQWKTIGADEIIRWGPMTDWQTIEAKPATGREHFIDFVEDLKGFALAFNTGHVLEVGNPLLGFPWVMLGSGGWSRNGWDPQGTTLIDAKLSEWEVISTPGFTVQRLGDTDTHKRFLVNLV
ncbi:MAG: hypothetical protein U0031_17175 [Thermomicrobiales bacterium]